VRLGLVFFIAYMSLFFVVVRLLLVRDLWLLLVYSSIANRGIIMMGVIGSQYLFIVGLYLRVIIFIIVILKYRESYNEILMVVFFFLVIPPFVLFFIKFYVILRLEFFLKIGFLFAIFDVLVLLYYFSLVFIKFLLIEVGVLVYFINIMILVFMLLLRSCDLVMI